MAINITFGDYDTVCYSNQHNIIQLIQGSVGLSIEVNTQAAQIGNIQSQLSDIAGVTGDLIDIMQGMTGDIQTIAELLSDIYSKLGGLQAQIDQLDYRITQLGG